MIAIKPTHSLRFVERAVPVPGVEQLRKVKILQQWWNKHELSESSDRWLPIEGGEWRDVPLESE